MKPTQNPWSASRTTCSGLLCLFLTVGLVAPVGSAAGAQQERRGSPQYIEENRQIRRDKFDLILPQIMRARGIDMWIHVMRNAIRDPFGAQDLGGTSGVFIFTDRGGDRIERAIVGRRWGASQRQRTGSDYVDPIEELDAYDIIGDPVFVGEPVSSPMTEYDYRFKGLREFVEARNPGRIAVNYRENLATWATSSRTDDGISHIDYLLLTEELGETYAGRLVSSEYLIMDYNVSPVASEVELLEKMRAYEVELVNQAFAEIVPGVTKNSEVGEIGDGEVDIVVFRRMRTGLSQRGRSEGWENTVVQGGDILAAPSQGMFAYVLRDGESEPPAEIKKLWVQYLTIDRILAETIRAGLTPREIMKSYKRKLEDAGIIVRDPQLHMAQPKNDFPVYSAGYDPGKTQLTLDLHGKGKGARERKFDIYLGPRMGSYGPDWTFDVPLSPHHHFVLEYFFYMPSPGGEGEDQYLLFWNHEQAIATASGVEYLSPPQRELVLIR